MRIHVEGGRTMIFEGPASLALVEGEASCLGAPMLQGMKHTVRKYRALPVYCHTPVQFMATMGEKASIKEVEGNTFPQTWVYASKRIISNLTERNTVVVVAGGIDVGKTTLSVYMANIALSMGCTVGLIDGDVGQAHLGPPATVSYRIVEKHIVDLSTVEPHRLVYIGAITPTGVTHRLLNALQELSLDLQNRVKLTVISTDGWIDGEEALHYKFELLLATSATYLVALQRSNELAPLIAEAEKHGFQIVEAEASQFARERSRVERKTWREEGYDRWLRDSTLRVLSLKHVRIRHEPLWRRGCMLGLYGSDDKLQGIGILEDFQLEKQRFKVSTNVRGDIASVEFGQVILQNGKDLE